MNSPFTCFIPSPQTRPRSIPSFPWHTLDLALHLWADLSFELLEEQGLSPDLINKHVPIPAYPKVCTYTSLCLKHTYTK